MCDRKKEGRDEKRGKGKGKKLQKELRISADDKYLDNVVYLQSMA
jgi:hypothetical protein